MGTLRHSQAMKWVTESVIRCEVTSAGSNRIRTGRARTEKEGDMPSLKARAVIFLLIAPAHAAVTTIGATNDTTIFQNVSNNSYGGGPGMFVGTDGTSTPRRGLLRFDIAGAVPAGATITDVQLTLTLALIAGSGSPNADTTPRSISLFRSNADWGEGTMGTGTTTGGSGNGLPAASGDATWNARHHDPTTAMPWTTPDGDASASASVTTT